MPLTFNEGLVSNVQKVIEASWWAQESFALNPSWTLFTKFFSIIHSKWQNTYNKQLHQWKSYTIFPLISAGPQIGAALY